MQQTEETQIRVLQDQVEELRASWDTLEDRQSGAMRGRWPFVLALVVGMLLAGSVGAWAGHQFPDVPPTHPFHDEIAWLADNEITGGFADGTFRPAEPVTRQAMAAFLMRAAETVVVSSDRAESTLSGQYSFGSANCPSGFNAVSGGVTPTGTTEWHAVAWSRPGIAQPNRWEAGMMNAHPTVTRTLFYRIYAVCQRTS